ncbi:MAG: TRAP transporter large permease subunit [Burkholderiales bacterium]
MSDLALLGLCMLVVMIGAIFIGFPISFTLLFLALSFGYFGLGDVVFSLAYFQTIGMMKEELLAAVPLFIFMGFITEQAGLMERLFTAFRLLLAPIRGALYAVVILTAAVFAMATGIVGAAVTVLGIMASPIMVKTGYDSRLSAGAITAGGTLGILIPPSVMLIVMGPVLGVSVADLYAAAFGPGLLLAGFYLAYLLTRAFINPKLGPPVPKEERIYGVGRILTEVFLGVVPLLGLIAATLGSILIGLATPTEASGIGALGAMILAAAYRKLTYAGLKRAVLSTTATASMVLLLAVTSNIFGAVFARMGSANWITESMLAMSFSPVLMLVMVLVLIFVLGWPFEWPAIVLVFLPIFYPVMNELKPALADSLNISPDMVMIWFGALVAVVLQTAFLSPPVAMSAYYLRQVVKDWSLANIYHGMFQFMFLQVIAIALIVSFPGIATWFPERLQAQARAVVVEDVEDGASLEDYHKEGSYADQLREAIEGTQEEEEKGLEEEPSLEEKEPEGEEDEKKADDLEKGDASKSK